MIVLKVINLGVRFVLEICLLVALGYWGFHVGGERLVDIVLGVGTPLLAALIWSTFVAPKARVRLSAPHQLACEVAIFGLGIAALYAAGQSQLAAIFAITAVISRILITRWGREAITYNPATVGSSGR